MRRINILTTVLIALLAAVGGAYFANPEGFKDTLRSKELYSSTRVAATTPDYTAEAFNAQAPAAGEAVKTEETKQAAPAAASASATAAPADASPPVQSSGVAPANIDPEVIAPTGDEPPAPDAAAAEKAKADAAAAEAKAAEPVAAQEEVKLDVALQMEDHVIGSPNAPLTIYDYSSLTCPHCGNFHNTILPKVKQYYIDTGKVRWVFRTFPHNEPALRAEMLARCLPRDQYLKMEDMMFANQQRWAFTTTPLPNLAMMVRVAGVDAAKFEACTTNKELEAAVLKVAQDGTEKYKIGSTPTFILNDGARKLEGGNSYEAFAYELDTFLENLAKNNAAAAQSSVAPAGKL